MFLEFLVVIFATSVSLVGLTKFANKKMVKILFAIIIILSATIAVINIASTHTEIERLKDDLTKKDKEIDDVKEYFYISKLGFNGFTQDLDNTGFGTNDSLYKLLEGTYFKQNDLIKYRCTKESMNKYKIAIVDYPKFPFTWFAIGECKYLNEEEDWKEYVQRAKEILEITTGIGGHKKEHDEALKQINEYLN
ncbi:MAG: hypothetical protein GF349_03045 [Candidatus Magasanikbacteria bacterium]|nr:hypothetical protein [Candidatus Magasanikbacteria bacterium]